MSNDICIHLILLLLKLTTRGQHETQQIREKPLLCVQAYTDHYPWGGLAVIEPPRLNTSNRFWAHILQLLNKLSLHTKNSLLHHMKYFTHCLPIDGEITFLQNVGSDSPRNMTTFRETLTFIKTTVRTSNLPFPTLHIQCPMFEVHQGLILKTLLL